MPSNPQHDYSITVEQAFISRVSNEAMIMGTEYRLEYLQNEGHLLDSDPEVLALVAELRSKLVKLAGHFQATTLGAGGIPKVGSIVAEPDAGPLQEPDWYTFAD